MAPVGKVVEVLRARIAELEELAIVAGLPYAHNELIDLHEFLDRLYTYRWIVPARNCIEMAWRQRPMPASGPHWEQADFATGPSSVRSPTKGDNHAPVVSVAVRGIRFGGVQYTFGRIAIRPKKFRQIVCTSYAPAMRGRRLSVRVAGVFWTMPLHTSSMQPPSAAPTNRGIERGDRLRFWLSDRDVLDEIVLTRESSDLQNSSPRLPEWLRSELRTQLQEKIAPDGEPITQKQADFIIDRALSSGTLDSDGTLTFRIKGTREQIVAQILEVCDFWNEPMSRATAEAKADAAIMAMWGRKVSVWHSSAILMVAKILAFILIIVLIAKSAGTMRGLQ